jgi:hypothetical protein
MGCINTWTFPVAVSTSARAVIEMFKNNNGINTYDYVDYRGKYITRNPFGFINEIKIGGSTTDADDADPKTKTKSEKRINVKQNATGLPRFGRL